MKARTANRHFQMLNINIKYKYQLFDFVFNFFDSVLMHFVTDRLRYKGGCKQTKFDILRFFQISTNYVEHELTGFNITCVSGNV